MRHCSRRWVRCARAPASCKSRPSTASLRTSASPCPKRWWSASTRTDGGFAMRPRRTLGRAGGQGRCGRRGPGHGRRRRLHGDRRRIARRPTPRLALDAALLHAMEPTSDSPRQSLPILLPHAGELASLLDCDNEEIDRDPIGCGLRAAELYRVDRAGEGRRQPCRHPRAAIAGPMTAERPASAFLEAAMFLRESSAACSLAAPSRSVRCCGACGCTVRRRAARPERRSDRLSRPPDRGRSPGPTPRLSPCAAS